MPKLYINGVFETDFTSSNKLDIGEKIQYNNNKYKIVDIVYPLIEGFKSLRRYYGPRIDNPDVYVELDN